MKKHFINLFILSFCLIPLYNCLAQEFIKTSEYDTYGHKRRDIYLDSNMQVVKEDYYSDKNQQIIFKIEYSSKNKFKKIMGLGEKAPLYEIDFKKGTYSDYENDVYLNFVGNFLFEGKQRSRKLVVNYKNNKKNGRLIQADSAETGKKQVSYQKVDPRFLQFNIVKFYNSIELDPVYTIFNGLLLNFKNGKLNGDQSSYYVNGKTKFQANFINDKLIRYTSFDQSNSIISKIETDSGLSQKPQIINGQVFSSDDQYVFWLNELAKTGDVVSQSNFYDPQIGVDFWNTLIYNNYANKLGSQPLRSFMIDNYSKTDFPESDIFNMKKKFDDSKYTFSDPEVIRIILGVPRFSIKQFSYTTNEDKLISKIKIINDGKIMTKLINDTIDLINGYYFLKSPLPYYEYSFPNSLPKRLLILPPNAGVTDYDKEETIKQNKQLAMWVKNTYNVTASNFYFEEKEDGAENYKLHFDTSFLYGFLRNMISLADFNCKELEKINPKTFQKEINYDFKSYHKHFYDTKYLGSQEVRGWVGYNVKDLYIDGDFISIVNKLDDTEIKIFHTYDRFKGKREFKIEVNKNSNTYTLLLK